MRHNHLDGDSGTTHSEKMAHLDEFDYDLPRELIAQQPMRQRTDARLLVVDRAAQSWQHHHVRDLPDLLRPSDCLVVNDTRVVPARLVGFRTATGGRWEGLYLSSDENGNWLVLSQTRGKIQVGEFVTLHRREGGDGVELRILSRLEKGRLLVRPATEQSVWDVLAIHGHVPIPPYIRGGRMIDSDVENYQTMFAQERGAVAAPTAGLHFTEALVARLKATGVQLAHITLHVGEGTFRPIATDDLDAHRMHEEFGEVSEETVNRLTTVRNKGGRIIAVGTTSTRVLETAAQSGTLRPFRGNTELFIRPPFPFRAIDGLMTNFHLPRSSLLVLVHAFAGGDLMRAAYRAAIEERYRFYSYGDAMLIV